MCICKLAYGVILVLSLNAENYSRTLAAIAAVESGNNSKAIGKLGETSEYQILPSTWKWAKGRTARGKAEWLLNWHRKRYLKVYGKKPNIKEIYIWWNTGKLKSKNKTVLKRAERVQNIWMKFQ